MKFEPIERVNATEAGLPPGVSELRRFLRRAIKARGTIRHGRRRHAVAIENLSEQGCQFWLPLRGALLAGETVTLTIEKLGPFEATVRWHRDGWTGIEFDLPVYAPVLDHIHDNFDRRRES